MLIAENPTPEIDELSQEISTSPAAATNEVSELTPEDPYPHISLHALSGLPSSETFCLYGELNHAHLTILIDSGSMHNFLQPRIAQFLHLPVKSTQPLRVLVRNGSILNCDQLCPDTSLSLQGHHFSVSFHLLPISGADAVLGIEWLKQFGPVVTDYTSLVMKFHHLSQAIEIHADVTNGPEPVSTAQVKRFIQTGSTSTLFHLSILPTAQPGPTSHRLPQSHLPHLVSAIETLLYQYQQLFQTPTTLSPPQAVTHHINLLPSSSPINVRPYQYPHFQKTKIEKQISNLLSASLIRPSTSPYSSPVLLVKKKDGTWRMCVDCRALNAVTIRDRFPIPTIDVLLDELGQSTWFSKLDLRQGFHQILMHEPDIEKTTFRTHHGHYEYRVMAFGLSNAPSTFQAAMNNLLTPFLRCFATVFFDDILVYSKSLSSHIHHLEAVFKALLHGQFYLKRAKCVFAQDQVEYLGHVVSGRGVEPEPSKIQAMTQWPVPSSAKDSGVF